MMQNIDDIHDMKEQLKVAQDMLTAIENQRNGAQNECVHLAAQLKAAVRKVQDLEAKLKGADEPQLPLSNGHAKVIDAEAGAAIR